MRLVLIIVCLFLSAGSNAQTPQHERLSWVCTYPGFSTDRKLVTATFAIKGDKLVDEYKHYDIIENNEYGIIAIDHYSQRDGPKGPVRIFSSTVIIDKTFGKFIFMVGEIGDEPGYANGTCYKE